MIDGKGQFMCGNKKCEEREGLRSWEVNFGYVEHGEKKNALVKLSKYRLQANLIVDTRANCYRDSDGYRFWFMSSL